MRGEPCSLVKEHPLTKECPPAIFDPIYCIGSKFSPMSAHPGASFVSASIASNAMHITGKKLCVILHRRLLNNIANAVRTRNYTVLTVTWCCSECCVSSGLDFKAANGSVCTSLLVQVFASMTLSRCKCDISALSKHLKGRRPPPPFQTCKVLRPWVLFHETTLLDISTFAGTYSHCYSNTSTQNPSHHCCNVNCKYRQHTSSCRSTPAWALSSSLTTSSSLAAIRAVLLLHCTWEIER